MKAEASPAPWYVDDDPWTLTQTRWEPEQNIYYETIFTQSNGYMGIRGYTEETLEGVSSWREGYLAGVFGQVDAAAMEQLATSYDWPMVCMITLPELFACGIDLDGEAFTLSRGRLDSFRRTLNMRNGLLTREVLWTSPAGRRTRLRFERFLSASVPHLGLQRIALTPENWDGEARLTFRLDAAIPSYFRCGDRSMPALPQALLEQPQIAAPAGGPASMAAMTRGTGHAVGIASGLQGESVAADVTETVLSQQAVLPLRKGRTDSMLHAVAVTSSRDGVAAEAVAAAAAEHARTALETGYEAALGESEAVWEHRWEMSDVVLDGPARDQAYLRFGTFSLLQMAPFHTDTISVPARAYAFNRYHGLYYWDSETFLMPQFLHTHPEIAENLLSFRYRTLDGARRTAGHLQSPGACYPWMTDSDSGTEQAPWHLGDYLWHQNADIAYAINQYVDATGDIRFMAEKGLEMLIETARFWMSRIEEDDTGVVHLHDTVGPDELDKHGRDNGYTSLMARRHLRLAVHWLADLSAREPDGTRRLTRRLKLADSEPDDWARVADRLAVPMVPGTDFPLQDEFLLAKKPLSFEGLTADEAFGMRHTHRVVKQADIIVALYLLQDEFTLDQMRAAYDFYEPMTLHYSSLSYNTHSIIATKIGRNEQAYEYFIKAAGLDLDNLRNSIRDGLHAAALGGTWQTVVNGFLGMRMEPDALVLDPRLPAAWNSIRLNLVYRGYRLNLMVSRDECHVEVSGGENLAPARLRLNGAVYDLAPAQWIKSSRASNGAGNTIKGVIFDLDGVIVSTDELHFQAWKRLADEEGIPFTREDNERLRGVSRMESLDIILEKATKAYSDDDKSAMAERKNNHYRESLRSLSPADILPGVHTVLSGLRERNVKLAIGSSSKNAVPILKAIGLDQAFDAIADGTHITRSKPDPEVFTLAGTHLALEPAECLVVEDAEAGVDAGLAAGMPVLAVGSAVRHPKATLTASGLNDITVDAMLRPEATA